MACSFLLGPFCVAALLLPGQEDPFPPGSPSELGLDPATLVELEARVRGLVEDEKIVGASLLVVKDRRTVLEGCWGMADIQQERPMQADTLFNIRSMTKVLTGMAAQLLVEEGELDLDEPVGDILEAFATPPHDQITVAQVLEHRSGLPLTVLQTGTREYDSLRALAEAGTQRPLVAAPGEKFWYSDAGTEVVAAVVEERSGQSIDSFVTERILEPLGMSESFYDLDPDHPRRRRMASGYLGSDGQWARFWAAEYGAMYPFAWGSQSLYSTPRDYARLMACWIDEGRAGDRPVLPAAAVQRALRPVSLLTGMGTDTPMPCGFHRAEARYGQMAVVWCREGGDEVLAFGHSGSDGTAAWAFPEHDLIVMLFTQTRGRADLLSVEPLLHRLVEPELIPSLPEAWRPYLGSYVATFGPFHNARFEVLEQNGGLAVDLAGRGVLALDAPDERGRWAASGGADFAFHFTTAEDGSIHSLTLTTEGQSFECPRGTPEPEPAIDAEAVADLLGEYLHDESGQRATLKVQEGRLVVRFSTEDADYALSRTARDDRWLLVANPAASLRFERDEQGAVVSVSLHVGEQRVVHRRVDD